MVSGTFQQWIENDAPGVFSATDELGITTTVQLAEYPTGQIIYEVFLGYQTHGSLMAREYIYNTPVDIVSANILTWEIPGEVTDG